MSEASPVYHVTVTREDNLWVAVVHDLPAGATDVSRMVDLEPEVRDLIAGLEDLDPDDFEISWHYRQGKHDLSPVVDELRQREATAAEAVLSRDKARLEAIKQLRDAGLSLRSIAELLGLSHQRVQQLASAAAGRSDDEQPCARV